MELHDLNDGGQALKQGILPQPGQPDKDLWSLRSSWLAQHEAPSPKKHRPAKRGRLDQKLEIIAAESALLFDSARAFVANGMASIERQARHALGRVKGGAPGAPAALIAMFALVIAIGSLAYMAVMDHILGPDKLSNAIVADSNGAGGTAPAGESVSQTAADTDAAAAPENADSNQANSSLFESISQSFGQAALAPNDKEVSVPSDVADLLNKNVPSTPAPSVATGGSVLDLTNSQAVEEVARQAYDQQTQRDQPAALYATVAYATPASAADDHLSRGVPAPSFSGQATGATSYPESVPKGQVARQNDSSRGARQPAPPAQATDRRTLSALESAQVMAATTGSRPGEVEGTARDAIAHGGKAVFELQHFDPSTGVLHPARIVVTATTLEFIPEASCEIGAFTIPLASVTSVQTGQSIPETSNASLLNIEFNDHGQHRLALRNSSPKPRGTSDAGHSSPPPSAAQQAALLTHVRNVILSVERSSSRPS